LRRHGAEGQDGAVSDPTPDRNSRGSQRSGRPDGRSQAGHPGAKGTGSPSGRSTGNGGKGKPSERSGDRPYGKAKPAKGSADRPYGKSASSERSGDRPYGKGKPAERSSDGRYSKGKPAERSSDGRYSKDRPAERSGDRPYRKSGPGERSEDRPYGKTRPGERTGERPYRKGGSAEQSGERPYRRSEPAGRSGDRPYRKSGPGERSEDRPYRQSRPAERTGERPYRKSGPGERSEDGPYRKTGAAERSGDRPYAKSRPAERGEDRPYSKSRSGDRPGERPYREARPDDRPWEAPRPGLAAKPNEPETPKGLDLRQLPRGVRAELRGLSAERAEAVGAHLLMAGRLIDSDPVLAHAHAEAARRRAARLPITREAAAETAYAAGEYSAALAEFRALRRMRGGDEYLPAMADCERALGRHQAALKLIKEGLAANPEVPQLVELRLVEAGVRVDTGRRDEALRLLKAEIERIGARGPKVARARLRYAYADLLERAGEGEQAERWFDAVVRLDPDQSTDAEDRLAALRGLVIEYDETEDDLPDETDEDPDGTAEESEE
jgi:tetratricopeptide (TPR) repeat protein